MKKLILSIIILTVTSPIYAQKNVTGLWAGTLNVGVEVHLVFHIKDSAEVFSVTMDSPDQGVNDIPASINIKQDSMIIRLLKGNGKYEGFISSDSTINGKWIQGGSYTLNMKKVKEIMLSKRPQTPKPPFPYKSEDVLYFNVDNSIQYGATITTPVGKGPFPSLLLITGSGQQNRDEEILQHRPFAVIADYLTRKGYIVMRVDDRGMGKTTGDVKNATSRDFANDAEVSIDYLKKLKDVDLSRIGLLGHSEGGMIAQMIAAERKDIDFLIFLAAPGEKCIKLMEDQNAAVLRSNGTPEPVITGYIKYYHNLIPAIISAPSIEDAKNSVSKLVDQWISTTDKNTVIMTTGINGTDTKEKYINSIVPVLYSPWFLYFLKYDPDIYLRKIKSKVLALNGDKDVQVIAETNLSAMEKSLKKGPSKKVDVIKLNGLNHLFQHCKSCSPVEYGKLEETISPEVLETIGKWLNSNVAYAH